MEINEQLRHISEIFIKKNSEFQESSHSKLFINLRIIEITAR